LETRRAILTCERTLDFVPGSAIPRKTLKDLLRAAMSAHYAGTDSPRHFLVVREESTLGELAELAWEDPSVGSASIAIAVCADNRTQRHMGQWVVDCSAASQNIVLLARDKELGAAWIRVFPHRSRMRVLAKFLRVPHYLTPFSLIFVGRPLRPLRKLGASADETKIHIDKW